MHVYDWELDLHTPEGRVTELYQRTVLRREEKRMLGRGSDWCGGR